MSEKQEGIGPDLFVLFIYGVIGIFAWPYVINTWLIYCGKTATVGWLCGFLIGATPDIGDKSLIFVILTYIAMLFLN